MRSLMQEPCEGISGPQALVEARFGIFLAQREGITVDGDRLDDFLSQRVFDGRYPSVDFCIGGQRALERQCIMHPCVRVQLGFLAMGLLGC